MAASTAAPPSPTRTIFKGLRNAAIVSCLAAGGLSLLSAGALGFSHKARSISARVATQTAAAFNAAAQNIGLDRVGDISTGHAALSQGPMDGLQSVLGVVANQPSPTTNADYASGLGLAGR